LRAATAVVAQRFLSAALPQARTMRAMAATGDPQINVVGIGRKRTDGNLTAIGQEFQNPFSAAVQREVSQNRAVHLSPRGLLPAGTMRSRSASLRTFRLIHCTSGCILTALRLETRVRSSRRFFLSGR